MHPSVLHHNKFYSIVQYNILYNILGPQCIVAQPWEGTIALILLHSLKLPKLLRGLYYDCVIQILLLLRVTLPSPDVGTLCTRDITYCMLNVHEVIRERECRIIIQINSVTSIFDLGSLVQVAEGGPPKKIILRPRWQWNYFPIEYDHPTLQRLEWYSVLRKAGHIG